MFVFAGRADDGTLAVAFDRRGWQRQCVQQAARHLEADRLQRFHHRQDVGLVAAGERVAQHGGDRATAHWHGGDGAELVEHGFDLGQDAMDFNHSVFM